MLKQHNKSKQFKKVTDLWTVHGEAMWHNEYTVYKCSLIGIYNTTL